MTSEITTELHLSEAERMFSKLALITSEHENYEFLVHEIGEELDNADKSLRGSMMSITLSIKEAYTARINHVRSGLIKHKTEVNRIKEAKRFRRRFL